VHTVYGDGTEIEDEVIDHIRSCAWEVCSAVRPAPGTLLICDNYLSLHGRLGYNPEDTRKVSVGVTYE